MISNITDIYSIDTSLHHSWFQCKSSFDLKSFTSSALTTNDGRAFQSLYIYPFIRHTPSNQKKTHKKQQVLCALMIL